MTRLPHDNRDVKGRDISTAQKLEEVCSHPFCDVRGRENLELHELWPRSFLRGQPIEFVELWDGTVVGNQVYLCNAFKNGHHQRITENIDQIYWQGQRFIWDNADWMDVGDTTLNPHPPLFGPHKPSKGKHPLYGTSPGGDAGYVLEGLTGPCPKCNGRGEVVIENKLKEKARNRVSKSIRVPKDEQENGVEVLEDMLVQVEEILRPGEKPRSPYYTLTDALGLVIVNKDVIL